MEVLKDTPKDIIRNLVEAGMKDPRFYPINLEQLPFLEVYSGR